MKLAERVRLEWLALAVIVIASMVARIVVTAEHCPRRVVVVDATVEILDSVTFVGDTISTRSLRTLDAVASTLEANSEITLVEVQATTEQRAQACIDYLVGQGIAPERLQIGLTGGHSVAFMIVKRDDSQP